MKEFDFKWVLVRLKSNLFLYLCQKVKKSYFWDELKTLFLSLNKHNYKHFSSQE
jgi:hypothetical protein